MNLFNTVLNRHVRCEEEKSMRFWRSFQTLNVFFITTASINHSEFMMNFFFPPQMTVKYCLHDCLSVVCVVQRSGTVLIEPNLWVYVAQNSEGFLQILSYN